MFNPVPRTAEVRGGTYKFLVQDTHPPTWETHASERNIRDAWWRVQPGDVVADVGASFGSYTLSALAQGAEKCFCFAPDDDAVLLRENLATNGWYDKATIYECGLWSHRGYLTTVGERTVVHKEMPPFWKTRRQSPSFYVNTFDTIMVREKMMKLDWIKIDVEGAELEVLRGAEMSLSILQPILLVENHLFLSKTIEQDCREFLASKKYRCLDTIKFDSWISHSLYQHEGDARKI